MDRIHVRLYHGVSRAGIRRSPRLTNRRHSGPDYAGRRVHVTLARQPQEWLRQAVDLIIVLAVRKALPFVDEFAEHSYAVPACSGSVRSGLSRTWAIASDC